MSVGLRPTTRCSFDEQQGVLRIALKEAVLNEDGSPVPGQQQIAVYALKVRSVMMHAHEHTVLTSCRFTAGKNTS